MEYTERYRAFLHMGGNEKKSNREYHMFISRMKKMYFECFSFSKQECILDQDGFTEFIWETVDRWISSGATIRDFLELNP